MKNVSTVIMYLVIGIIVGVGLDLMLTSNGHWFTTIMIIISIILLFMSGKFLEGNFLHGWTPDREYRSDLPSGFNLIPLGFFPWSVVSYTGKNFSFNDSFEMVKKGSTKDRLHEYVMPTKTTSVFRIINQEKFYRKTGLRYFDGKNLSLEAFDFLNDVISNLRTSFNQLGWIMGYEGLLEDADWNLERILKEIEAKELKDTLGEQLAMYGLELVSVSLEVDLTAESRKVIQDVFNADREEEAVIKRAETQKKAAIIKAEGEAEAKSKKDNQLAIDIETNADRFMKLAEKHKHSITMQDALDLASAALNVFENEYFFKNSGSTNIVTDVTNKLFAGFIGKEKK